MRSFGWYALATSLGLTAAAFVLGFFVPRMELPIALAAGATTLTWAVYVTRGLGERRGPWVQGPAALALTVVAGLAAFVVVFGGGYIGLAIVFAAYAVPLYGGPDANPSARAS